MTRKTAFPASPFVNGGYIKQSKDKEDVSILFSGDLCPIAGYGDCFISGEVDKLMPDILQVTSKVDLHLTNLELPLSRRGKPIKKCGPNFRADPNATKGLKQLGITHACLANNHIGDYGAIAIQDTINTLEKNKITPVGIVSGHNAVMEPLFFRKKGVKFCLLNVAEAEFSYPTDKRLGASFLDEPVIMESLRNASARADVTMVIVHGGREYQYIPPIWMQTMYRRFLSCGADIVIAHHAHVPQGIEVSPNGVICYSLGNFIFDFGPHAANPGTSLGYMVKCGISRKGLGNIEIIPTIKHHDYSINIPTSTTRDKFLEFLANISIPLKNEKESMAIWKEYLRHDAPDYLNSLKMNIKSYNNDTCTLSEEHAKILFGSLAVCRTHREITSAATQLYFEGDTKSVMSTARIIKGWEQKVKQILK